MSPPLWIPIAIPSDGAHRRRTMVVVVGCWQPMAVVGNDSDERWWLAVMTNGGDRRRPMVAVGGNNGW